MADPGLIRVSDAERERLVEELHEHTVAGRLTAEEYEERLEAVYAARTRADLDALRTDLPVSTVARAPLWWSASRTYAVVWPKRPVGRLPRRWCV
ncbi:MAG: DUF1707 SHOCT-like domain-containing protein [Solirubrobacteraceae bacterium]